MSNNENESNEQDMANLGVIIAAYTEENAAADTLSRLKEARSEGSIDYDDAVVVHQTTDGDVKFNETRDMSVGEGAGIGALLGATIAVLGGPAGLLLSTGVSAATGGLLALHDSGFDNDSIKKLGAALKPGSSAILVTTSKQFTEEVRREARESDRQATLESLSTAISSAMKNGNNILFGLFLDGKNVMATQIEANDEVVSVFGAAADSDSMVASQAIVDAQGNAAYSEVSASSTSSDTNGSTTNGTTNGSGNGASSKAKADESQKSES